MQDEFFNLSFLFTAAELEREMSRVTVSPKDDTTTDGVLKGKPLLVHTSNKHNNNNLFNHVIV